MRNAFAELRRVVFLLTLTLSTCVWWTYGQSDRAPDCQVFTPSHNLDSSLLASLPNSISTVGTNRLIFFRARFPDDKSDPITLEKAESTLREVAETFTRLSYGQFILTWEVSPVLNLTKDRETYNGPGGFDRFIEDVRQAGMAAGYDFRKFDLDLVRHSGVSDFHGGNANLGSRGAQVQAPGAVIIVHELGHNLGLSHANLWTTGSPGVSMGSPPLPSNYSSLPDPRSIPVYPDSALGHESITGPGSAAEYGDLWDIMGLGSVEFNAIYRYQLGWLSDAAILPAPAGLSTNRLQGTDGSAPAGLPRVIRAGGLFQSPAGHRQYWIQLPPVDTNRLDLPGVLLRWADLSPAGGGSLQLAPLAGDPAIPDATVLPVGRTFSDFRAGIHVTVLDVSGLGENRWADVAIFNGASLSNRAPTVTLSASAVAVNLHESVSFSAAAIDPDGDPLTWRWDFGDGTASTTAAAVAKSWRRAGDFVVALEVSDRKGGTARAHVPIRVGNPGTLRITGRIVDPLGQPVAGVRVHNGMSGNEQSRNVTTFTDATGAYTLAGLLPGTYTNGAFAFGYSIDRRPPLTLTSVDVTNVNFIASPLPRVSVAAPSRIGESTGITNLFVFTRTGSIAQPLTVLYSLEGSATGGRDYARPFVDRMVIPAGATSAPLSLDIFDDQASEPEETIRLEVVFPTTAQRLDSAGNFFTVYYPGVELAEVDGTVNWVVTDPTYLPAIDAAATVMIEDNDVQSSQVVSLFANDLAAIEEPRVDSSFTLRRTGNLDQPLNVELSTEGTAQNGVDYVPVPNSVRFDSGESEKILAVEPIADGLAEGEEQILLRILPKPEYGIEVAAATVAIRDNALVAMTLATKRLGDGTLQLTLKGQPGSRLVLETSSDFSTWLPIRTNLLFNSDIAVLTLPVQTQSFYRTVRDTPQ